MKQSPIPTGWSVYPSPSARRMVPLLLRKEARAYVRLEMQRVQRLTRGFILSQPIGKAVYSISD